MTYALYWEVEVEAEDEEEAYEMGRELIPIMTINEDDWLLTDSEKLTEIKDEA
jgi:hypothetical protein